MDVEVVVENVAQIVSTKVSGELSMVWGAVVPNWADFEQEVRNEVINALMAGGEDPLGDAAEAVTLMINAWADEGLLKYKTHDC